MVSVSRSCSHTGILLEKEFAIKLVLGGCEMVFAGVSVQLFLFSGRFPVSRIQADGSTLLFFFWQGFFPGVLKQLERGLIRGNDCTQGLSAPACTSLLPGLQAVLQSLCLPVNAGALPPARCHSVHWCWPSPTFKLIRSWYSCLLDFLGHPKAYFTKVPDDLIKGPVGPTVLLLCRFYSATLASLPHLL